ncbi:MAG: OadG family protein [Spirochaetales bacterium]|nr:OadG family protein [Spirochaetales bacterium]
MQEHFSYSLMASGLGILIVFLILVLLSVLMIVIRKFSDDNGSKNKQPASAPAPAPLQAAPVTVAKADNEWIIAAVAAFIAVEDEDLVVPQASSWSPSVSEKYDPWVNTNKLSKTVSGV